MSVLARWRALSVADRLLLAEAAVLLPAAALALALLPFRSVAALASRPTRGPPQVEPGLPDRVRWAVEAAARRSPLRALCFEQGLAAQWMLRRRGLPAQLNYGVTREGGRLPAHVWVTLEGRDVIGGRDAVGYRLLAVFPAAGRGSSEGGD